MYKGNYHVTRWGQGVKYVKGKNPTQEKVVDTTPYWALSVLEWNQRAQEGTLAKRWKK